MNTLLKAEQANVRDLFARSRVLPISDELQRLATTLADLCPDEAIVQFVYADRLSVNVDVRTMEDVFIVEAVLGNVLGSTFRDVRRVQAPNRSFLRRVTANVDR